MLPSTCSKEACLPSLESALVDCGVHPFHFMLSLWSPSFSPQCGSRPPWLSLHSWSGTQDWRLCSFSSWQRRLRGTCQLLSLRHWGHSFLFGRPSMFEFFRWSLCHSERSLLVSAAPTSLPFFFFSATIWLSFCPRHPVLSSIFSFFSNSVADLAGTVFSLLFYQATMGSRTLVSHGKRRGW